jgi:6-phosphogluconolactonase (cycloisomerase 2 family)
MNWMGGLRFARIARLLLLCGLTSGFVTSHVKAQYAYMCGEFNEFDSAIWSYHIEPSGALTPIAGSPFPGPSFPAGSMALDPKGNYLYITDPTNALVWTYTIEKNGALILLANTFSWSSPINQPSLDPAPPRLRHIVSARKAT